MRRRRGRRWQCEGAWAGIPIAPGLLEAMLLLHLRSGGAHGYDLVLRLSQCGFGGFNPGVVYRALRGMEGLGWIFSKWDGEQSKGPPRRVYFLSAQGEKALEDLVRGLKGLRGIMDGIITAYERQG